MEKVEKLPLTIWSQDFGIYKCNDVKLANKLGWIKKIDVRPGNFLLHQRLDKYKFGDESGTGECCR